MDERLQFVARQLAGEAMAELCREFGISRKTGYKIFDRYAGQATGAAGEVGELGTRYFNTDNSGFLDKLGGPRLNWELCVILAFGNRWSS